MNSVLHLSFFIITIIWKRQTSEWLIENEMVKFINADKLKKLMIVVVVAVLNIHLA